MNYPQPVLSTVRIPVASLLLAQQKAKSHTHGSGDCFPFPARDPCPLENRAGVREQQGAPLRGRGFALSVWGQAPEVPLDVAWVVGLGLAANFRKGGLRCGRC